MENTCIKLNSHYTLNIDGFSRNTSVQDGKLVSNAYVTLKNPQTEDIETLRGLALYPITELELDYNETAIYSQTELTAKITSIDESLTDEGKMRCAFYIYF